MAADTFAAVCNPAMSAMTGTRMTCPVLSVSTISSVASSKSPDASTPSLPPPSIAAAMAATT